MSRRLVADAGPLIALGKLNQIGLISSVCQELIVPTGVAHEIEQGPEHDPSRLWIEGPGRERIRSLEVTDLVLTSWDLGRGETEALAWARHNPGFEAVVDDLAARRCAAVLQIPVRGTVGILVLARKANLIPAVRPLLDQLLAVEYRLDRALYEKALRLVGE